jgi:hypothetical protein
MMRRFFKLDTVIRRAPLGLRFLDLVRAVSVNDGLVVTARRIGTPGPKQLAFRSPLSGIYSFRALPRLGRFEVVERPASDWCTSSADAGEPTAEELTDIQKLRGLLRGDQGLLTKANFIISVEDSMERFLPQVLLMCLPTEKLVEVPLFSSPARLAPAGLGVVRGELVRHDTQPPQPAKWALVTVTLGNQTYVAVADARGMFTLFVSYASVLPLVGSPAQDSRPVDRLTWQLTIQVFYQPEKQSFVSELEPPDIRSIMEQGSANIYEDVEASHPAVPTITSSIKFAENLVVRTLHHSQLFVDPAF